MKLSVIIPTWNEEYTILQTIHSLQSQETSYPIEWIIVDGGSTDATVQLAESSQVTVIYSERGRAKQMNAGALVATGNVLLFLHSDSILSQGCLEELGKMMSKEEVVGGCFRLAFSDSNFLLDVIAWGSHLRAKLGKIMFGDQGIFVRREIFEVLGGFPDIELMEDLEFSARIKSYGKIETVNKRIFTSSRRFRKGGIIKTFWLMQRIKWMYWRGVPPAVLKKYYDDRR